MVIGSPGLFRVRVVFRLVMIAGFGGLNISALSGLRLLPGRNAKPVAAVFTPETRQLFTILAIADTAATPPAGVS